MRPSCRERGIGGRGVAAEILSRRIPPQKSPPPHSLACGSENRRRRSGFYCIQVERRAATREQGCSVTAYRIDGANGTLSSVQTTSTLPAGHSERTTCSQIHLTPSGRFLYVGNRAVNGSSMAAFAVDPETGHLTAAGHSPTEAVPSAFCLDPAGHFLFAAGTASGRLDSYRINQQSGALTPLALEEVGHRPAAVLATRIG
jgi:6-phosphogluconolactonase (cycloisomerase 2 family)